MTITELRAPTSPGCLWSCSACRFEASSIDAAAQHCAEESGDYPDAEHMLHEMPPDCSARNRARRIVYCRDKHGRAGPVRVARSKWRVVDGGWELKGVTTP